MIITGKVIGAQQVPTRTDDVIHIRIKLGNGDGEATIALSEYEARAYPIGRPVSINLRPE